MMKRVFVFAGNNGLFYLAPVFLLILGDVFLFSASSDFRIFGILFFFLILVRRFKLHSITTFLLSMLLFLLTYVQFIFSDPSVFHQPAVPAVERTAVWLYLFLLVGVIQKWRE